MDGEFDMFTVDTLAAVLRSELANKLAGTHVYYDEAVIDGDADTVLESVALILIERDLIKQD